MPDYSFDIPRSDLVCPYCQHVNDVLYTDFSYEWTCANCEKEYVSKFVKIRSKRSKVTSEGREWSVRVYKPNGGEDLFEFSTNTKDEFELRQRDLAIFTYYQNKLTIIQNLTINRKMVLFVPRKSQRMSCLVLIALLLLSCCGLTIFSDPEPSSPSSLSSDATTTSLPSIIDDAQERTPEEPSLIDSLVNSLSTVEVQPTEEEQESLSAISPTDTLESSSPTPTLTDLLVVVDVSRANIRTGPGVNYNLVGTVEQNTELEVIGRTENSNWLYVLYADDQKGWIGLSVLSVTGSLTSIEVIATPSAPIPVAPSSNPSPTQPVISAPCSCGGDSLNCGNFSTHSQAQTCFAYCLDLGVGDIHRLDRDNDGIACENLP